MRLFAFFVISVSLYLTACSNAVEENAAITKTTARYSIRKSFSIEGSGSFPDSLSPIFPNPYNHNAGDSTVALHFTLRDSGNVKIIIQNPLGDSVAIFKDEMLAPGNFTGFWDPKTTDGTRLKAGLYFITIRIAPDDPNRNYINSKLLDIESND
jgi:hypothetical protein